MTKLEKLLVALCFVGIIYFAFLNSFLQAFGISVPFVDLFKIISKVVIAIWAAIIAYFLVLIIRFKLVKR